MHPEEIRVRGPHDRAKENSEEFSQLLRLNRELTGDKSFLLPTKIDGDRPPGNSAEGTGEGEESNRPPPANENWRNRGSLPRNLGGFLEIILVGGGRGTLADRADLTERTNGRRNDRLFLTRRARSAARARERDGECPKLRWCQWTRPCEESAGASSSAILAISGSCLSHGTETNFVTLRKRRGARARADNVERGFLERFFRKVEERSLFAFYDYIWRTRRLRLRTGYSRRAITWLDISRVIIKHVGEKEEERKRDINS